MNVSFEAIKLTPGVSSGREYAFVESKAVVQPGFVLNGR
jgi:hypothetical protein